MTVRQRFFGMNWEAMHGIMSSCGKKLAAEDAHRKMVGEAAWKQYLQLDELCNELESVRYQAMYLAGAADFEKLFRQS